MLTMATVTSDSASIGRLDKARDAVQKSGVSILTHRGDLSPVCADLSDVFVFSRIFVAVNLENITKTPFFLRQH